MLIGNKSVVLHKLPACFFSLLLHLLEQPPVEEIRNILLFDSNHRLCVIIILIINNNNKNQTNNNNTTVKWETEKEQNNNNNRENCVQWSPRGPCVKIYRRAKEMVGDGGEEEWVATEAYQLNCSSCKTASTTKNEQKK